MSPRNRVFSGHNAPIPFPGYVPRAIGKVSARATTGRDRILLIQGGYHGANDATGFRFPEGIPAASTNLDDAEAVARLAFLSVSHEEVRDQLAETLLVAVQEALA